MFVRGTTVKLRRVIQQNCRCRSSLIGNIDLQAATQRGAVTKQRTTAKSRHVVHLVTVVMDLCPNTLFVFQRAPEKGNNVQVPTIDKHPICVVSNMGT